MSGTNPLSIVGSFGRLSNVLFQKSVGFNCYYNCVRSSSHSIESKKRHDQTHRGFKKRNIESQNISNSPNVLKLLEPNVIKFQDDCDMFGLLADSEKHKNLDIIASTYQKEKPDDDTEIFRRDQRKSLLQCNLSLRKLLKENKLKDALEFFENEMLYENKVKPSPWTYSLLINGCGAAGYTKKAFTLFRRMRGKGMKPTPATLTGLFMACAKSPFKDYGLKKAKALREKIFDKGWNMNTTHYHALISALGKCGDIASAFQVVDEMIELKIPLKIQTMNFLVSACISDSKEGLKNAILVWRKMRTMKMKPDIYTYNLLLRTIRDCNVGDSPTKDLLKLEDKVIIPAVPTDKDVVNPHLKSSNVTNNMTNGLPTTVDQATTIPDILSPKLISSNVISLNNMKERENRLALFGGMPGILSQMVRDGVKPNIKTFTQLLDSIPMRRSSEQQLLDAMEDHKIIPDVDMCNMIIKRRAFRFHDRDALNVLDTTMKKFGISPNIMTFGVLALVCRSHKSVVNLLKSMDDSGLHLNVEIIGTLVKNACVAKDPTLILKLMNRIKDDNIAVNPMVLESLENLIQSEEYRENQDKFKYLRMQYKSWLRKIPLDLPEHPWKQYHVQKPRPEFIDSNIDRHATKEK